MTVKYKKVGSDAVVDVSLHTQLTEKCLDLMTFLDFDKTRPLQVLYGAYVIKKFFDDVYKRTLKAVTSEYEDDIDKIPEGSTGVVTTSDGYILSMQHKSSYEVIDGKALEEKLMTLEVDSKTRQKIARAINESKKKRNGGKVFMIMPVN